MEIDRRAQTFALDKSLIIPIAAVDEAAIEKYVGEAIEISTGTTRKAFHVKYSGPLAARDNTLPIWDLPGSENLHSNDQVWVHVDYSAYRKAYLKVFPEHNIRDYVVDHIANRRFARNLGFKYIRLCAVSRGANTSSGRGPENEAVKYQDSPDSEGTEDNAEIMYADPADIVKMLNIKTGHFPLEGVRRSLYLMYHSSRKPDD